MSDEVVYKPICKRRIEVLLFRFLRRLPNKIGLELIGVLVAELDEAEQATRGFVHLLGQAGCEIPDSAVNSVLLQ